MNLETTIVVALIAAVPTVVSLYLSNRSQKNRDASDEKRADTERIAAKTARRKVDAEIASLVSNSETVIWNRTQAMMKVMTGEIEAERKKRKGVESTVFLQAKRIAALEKSDRHKGSVIEKQAIRIAALEESDGLKGVVIEEQAKKIASLESENKALRLRQER